MKILLGIGLLLILFISLQYSLWLKPEGIKDLISLKKAIASQEQINSDLLKKNQQLRSRVFELKHNPTTVDALARSQLGMIKKGEVYYQFVEPSSAH